MINDNKKNSNPFIKILLTSEGFNHLHWNTELMLCTALLCA